MLRKLWRLIRIPDIEDDPHMWMNYMFTYCLVVAPLAALVMAWAINKLF